MPVVEAMACGLPVIVTGAGPALDYASDETAFLIPARRGQFAECRVGDLETIGRPWLFEPDADALVELLRRVAGDRAAARAKGMAASEHIRSRFTWERTVDAVEQRLLALAGEMQNQPRMNTDLHGWECGSASPSRGAGLAVIEPSDTAGRRGPWDLGHAAPATHHCSEFGNGPQMTQRNADLKTKQKDDRSGSGSLHGSASRLLPSHLRSSATSADKKSEAPVSRLSS